MGLASGRALVPPAPCMNLTRRLTTGCSGWSAARSPLNRSVNAAELRTALWRRDLSVELPHLAETCRLICVHSYIVCQIKPKLLHVSDTCELAEKRREAS
jgi:hypothetical protein